MLSTQFGDWQFLFLQAYHFLLLNFTSYATFYWITIRELSKISQKHFSTIFELKTY